MGKPPRVLSEYETAATPPLEEQQQFWDTWNEKTRFGTELDEFMERQRDSAMDVARAAGLSGARILDAGCGTGWLANELLPFGEVWATDLSQAAITEGQKRHPGVRMVCGDFLSLDLPQPFDFIVMSDSLSNMYDPPAGVRRVAALLREGGTFLLMTPNREVWLRRSVLQRKGSGQFMAWPPLSEYKAMLADHFTTQSIATIVPGGDSGRLFWVENRWVRGGMRRLIGAARWQALLERLGLGRHFVIVARRNAQRA